jgi:hypothetical protein
VLSSAQDTASDQGDGTEETLSADGAARAKKKAPKCYRCGMQGHFLNDCTIELCDICQLAGHDASSCPLRSAPKPEMKMFGFAYDELMFWELPITGSIRPRVENTRMGRITVSNGTMTIPEVISQLQWVVPDDQYQWEVRQIDENVFQTTFPSKMDLLRAQHFGAYKVPNSPCSMSFDFLRSAVQPAWMAETIWVRMHGLPPSALDDYLSLWALGGMFGKTLDIDMAFPRKKDVLRIHILCLDPSLIQDRMDILIKDGFYKLHFEVEGRSKGTEDMVTDLPKKNDDDDDDSLVRRLVGNPKSKV